ncbi:MAG: superoxide dismutase [Sphingobacteriales bacterium]|nr:MAG: superoxide dismutase [Sphingobacteriales bacterium]
MAPSRREFLITSAKAGIGLAIGSSLASCASAQKVAASKEPTGYTQAPLPYGYGALEAAIDARTMELHYSKHAASYAANLNDAAKAEGVDTSKPLEDALRNVSKRSAKFRNNGGGHFNHELYWKTMSPNGGTLDGPLKAAIAASFGSEEAFKKQFADAGTGRFGSGWAWLYVDNDKKLRIGSTPNQDNPLMDVSDIHGEPLLGLDVWEHAYYLRYQNKRADYIANWWKVVNWNYLQQRYQNLV